MTDESTESEETVARRKAEESASDQKPFIAQIEDPAPPEEETKPPEEEVKVPRGKRGFIFRGPAHSLEFNDTVLRAGDSIVVKAADADELLRLGRFEEVAQPGGGEEE